MKSIGLWPKPDEDDDEEVFGVDKGRLLASALETSDVALDERRVLLKDIPRDLETLDSLLRELWHEI